MCQNAVLVNRSQIQGLSYMLSCNEKLNFKQSAIANILKLDRVIINGTI